MVAAEANAGTASSPATTSESVAAILRNMWIPISESDVILSRSGLSITLMG